MVTVKTNSVPSSPQANNAVRALVSYLEFSANFCRKKNVAWSEKRVPTAVNPLLQDRSRYFSFKYLLSYPHETEWTPFQTCYF
jgi:hypothetical protein